MTSFPFSFAYLQAKGEREAREISKRKEMKETVGERKQSTRKRALHLPFFALVSLHPVLSP